MIEEIRRLRRRPHRIAVGAGGHQFGGFLAQLLEPEVSVGQELGGVTPRPGVRRPLGDGPVEPA